ncbi:MAG: histidine phosphatase family protein [Oscillospiraceae bacterium]|nr:histidine phosphatase family protein [Oscillospiraceae bacterium]
MRKILLVRHGESEANEKGIYGGTKTDYSLSKRGFEQAKALAGKLIDVNIDEIYSSPLKRAIQTVEPIAKILGKEIKIEDDLIEIHVGVWEDTLREELINNYPELQKYIEETGHNDGIEGQEETKDVAARMVKVLNKIVKESDGKVILIASHIVSIRAWLCAIMNIPFEETKLRLGTIDNAEITFVDYDDAEDKFKNVIIGNRRIGE